MVNSTEVKEQVRTLTNKVVLAGAVAELSKMNEGIGKDGIPYLSFHGAIQVGEDKAQTVKFKVYVKSRKTNGEESKAYANMKKFYSDAIPMTTNPTSPTYIEMLGSLTDNPYVSQQGVLVEDVTYSMQTTREFSEYKAEIDLEGYLEATSDEMVGQDGEYTGRKRASIISRDIFGSTIRLKNIVIEKEAVQEFENSDYDIGCTATFLLDLKLHEGNASSSNRSATMFGNSNDTRVTTGKAYLEKVLIGADKLIPRDSENALSIEIVGKLMAERNNKLDSIKAAGYRGTSTPTRTASNTSYDRAVDKNGFLEPVEPVNKEDW